MIKELDLNEFKLEVYRVADEHGWHEYKREIPEVYVMCNRELSESAEAVRNGEAMVYYVPDKKGVHKPEGVAVELIDCVLRLLDRMAEEGVEYEPTTNDLSFLGKASAVELIAKCHYHLTIMYDNWGKGFTDTAVYSANLCICAIKCWLTRSNQDFYGLLQIKHEYNKTREYRHGGKKT